MPLRNYPTPADFFLNVMQGYRETKVLLTANALRLFDALEEAEQTADEVASALGCNGRVVGLLLDALVAMQVVEACDGRYANTALASQHLVSSAKGYVGDVLAFHDLLWDGWSSLATIVRTGEPFASLATLLEDHGTAFAEAYIRGMHRLAAMPAREVIGKLIETPVSRFLDVGGGPGTYCLELLARSPQARATLLDLPATLRVTERIIDSAPPADRLTLRPGNYLTDEYGEDLDLILMSHVTHDESPAAVVDMARRAFRALRPGGRLAIHDWTTGDPQHTHPTFAALFSVNLMVYTQGRLYSQHEYRSYLSAAGFEGLASYPIQAGMVSNPTRLLVACRPPHSN